jgi:hypothetical protein
MDISTDDAAGLMFQETEVSCGAASCATTRNSQCKGRLARVTRKNHTLEKHKGAAPKRGMTARHRVQEQKPRA